MMSRPTTSKVNLTHQHRKTCGHHSIWLGLAPGPYLWCLVSTVAADPVNVSGRSKTDSGLVAKDCDLAVYPSKRLMSRAVSSLITHIAGRRGDQELSWHQGGGTSITIQPV